MPASSDDKSTGADGFAAAWRQDAAMRALFSGHRGPPTRCHFHPQAPEAAIAAALRAIEREEARAPLDPERVANALLEFNRAQHGNQSDGAACLAGDDELWEDPCSCDVSLVDAATDLVRLGYHQIHT